MMRKVKKMRIKVISKYSLVMFSLLIFSGCTSVVKSNAIQPNSKEQNLGFFSYKVDMENPQAMPQHLGSFNKRGDCIFFRTVDGKEVTPIFPYEFVKFNKGDNFILMENKVVNFGNSVSVGGYITTPTDYNNYLTKGDKSCLLSKVIVLGVGTEVLK